MNLIKTSLLNAVAVAVKMITLLGINKVLAIYVGPSGYAAIGQFQNAVQIITTVASGAINTGVTKYTAEYHDDEKRQQAIWRTSGTIALISSLFTALLVSIFNKPLAGWFLNDETMGSVFIWFSCSLIFFVFNTLLLAILNGKKEIQRYVTANIAGSVISLAITSLLTIFYGLYGALIALAIYQSLNFIATLILTYKLSWFKLRYFFGSVDKSSLKNLLKYAAMAITSAACVPLSHILVRNHIGETLGWNNAGYWEAMWRLSGAYLMFVTMTLSVYYLPRLSELKSYSEVKKEIISGYKIILPVAAICGVFIYLLRDFIIRVLFTSDFHEMETLFFWQMIGDTLKIGSWILAFLMLSKALTLAFIITEIVFASLFYFLTVFFVNHYGLEGAAIAHTVNYLLYWVVAFYIAKSAIKQVD